MSASCWTRSSSGSLIGSESSRHLRAKPIAAQALRRAESRFEESSPRLAKAAAASSASRNARCPFSRGLRSASVLVQSPPPVLPYDSRFLRRRAAQLVVWVLRWASRHVAVVRSHGAPAPTAISCDCLGDARHLVKQEGAVPLPQQGVVPTPTRNAQPSGWAAAWRPNMRPATLVGHHRLFHDAHLHRRGAPSGYRQEACPWEAAASWDSEA